MSTDYRTAAREEHFACEQCGTLHARDRGVYAPNGALLCPACLARVPSPGVGSRALPWSGPAERLRSAIASVVTPRSGAHGGAAPPRPLREVILGGLFAWVLLLAASVFAGMSEGLLVLPLAFCGGAVGSVVVRPQGRRAYWALGLVLGTVLLALLLYAYLLAHPLHISM